MKFCWIFKLGNDDPSQTCLLTNEITLLHLVMGFNLLSIDLIFLCDSLMSSLLIPRHHYFYQILLNSGETNTGSIHASTLG